MNENVDKPEKKKRGRKPKPKNENQEKPLPKKRGRKPKGGKIVEKVTSSIDSDNYIQKNIILHLKCNNNDIKNNENNNSYLSNNPFIENKAVSYKEYKNEENEENEENIVNFINNNENNNEKNVCITTNKDLSKKIKDLQKQLFFDECSDKKSACFWCTYDFDNQSIYIPRYKINENYQVYGCFCSPECAVSYLMNENIDISQKYERFQLLNYIYGTAFDYGKDIQPAPNPYYTLDKYYGNMSIIEYRHLLKNNRFLLVVEKPLTRILPEIYEETESQFSINNVTYNQSTFQIKKKNNENIQKKSIF